MHKLFADKGLPSATKESGLYCPIALAQQTLVTTQQDK